MQLAAASSHLKAEEKYLQKKRVGNEIHELLGLRAEDQPINNHIRAETVNVYRFLKPYYASV